MRPVRRPFAALRRYIAWRRRARRLADDDRYIYD
jgi:hypothetical protein